MMAGNAMTNRQASQAPGAGRVYSVGCLPILLVWFLLDLIGKAIIWGVAALFGVQFAPAWPKIFLVGSLATVGVPIVAVIVFWLYLIISDLLCKLFRKDKEGKSPPTGTSS